MLQGTTDEVKKQAEPRINSRFTMYVPGIHNLAVKNIQRGRRYGHSAESQKLEKAKDELDVAKNMMAERSWSATSRTSSVRCACTNEDTRCPTRGNI